MVTRFFITILPKNIFKWEEQTSEIGKKKEEKREKKERAKCVQKTNQTGIKKELLTCCGKGKIIFF
jgi:hypothetical protein